MQDSRVKPHHHKIVPRIFCLLLATIPAHSEWITLRTPQLELLTDAGEKTAGRVLDRMATIRQVLGQGSAPERPLRVFVFASERQFHSYAQGSVTQGYFQSGPERDYIVLPASGFNRVVAHEYVHRILNRGAPRYPKWLDEGLAEFYSTLEVKGGNAIIGLPIEAHLATLAKMRRLTAQELDSVATAARFLNERELAGIFYAQSWGLVHMLKLAPGWRENMPAYLQKLAAGEDASRAFRAAFGRTLDEAIKELPGYLQHIRAARLEVQPKLAEDAPAISTMDELGSTLTLADLALHAGKFDLARKLFEGAARSHPDSPEAEAGLGTLAMAQNRRSDALAHLRRATELRAPGGEIYFELAMFRRDEDAPSSEVDQLLERAIAADPSYAEAHLLLGQREADRGDYAQAIPHLQLAASILPRQSDIWHALAFAQSKAGQKDAARDSARRALETARNMEHERMARALLESLE